MRSQGRDTRLPGRLAGVPHSYRRDGRPHAAVQGPEQVLLRHLHRQAQPDTYFNLSGNYFLTERESGDGVYFNNLNGYARWPTRTGPDSTYALRRREPLLGRLRPLLAGGPAITTPAHVWDDYSAPQVVLRRLHRGPDPQVERAQHGQARRRLPAPHPAVLRGPLPGHLLLGLAGGGYDDVVNYGYDHHRDQELNGKEGRFEDGAKHPITASALPAEQVRVQRLRRERRPAVRLPRPEDGQMLANAEPAAGNPAGTPRTWIRPTSSASKAQEQGQPAAGRRLPGLREDTSSTPTTGSSSSSRICRICTPATGTSSTRSASAATTSPSGIRTWSRRRRPPTRSASRTRRARRCAWTSRPTTRTCRTWSRSRTCLHRPANFASYRNTDFGTIKGVDLNLQVLETMGVSGERVLQPLLRQRDRFDLGHPAEHRLDRSAEAPKQTAPLSFDQRHKISLNVDYQRRAHGRTQHRRPVPSAGEVGPQHPVQRGQRFPLHADLTQNEVTLAAVSTVPSGADQLALWPVDPQDGRQADAELSRGRTGDPRRTSGS